MRFLLAANLGLCFFSGLKVVVAQMGRKRRKTQEPLELVFAPGDEPLMLNRGLQSGDRLRVIPSGLTKKGDGRARVELKIGSEDETRVYTLSIRRALPDEVVDVVLEARRRRNFTARVEARIEPSPHRVEPRCSHFGERETPGKGCGGCSIQSLSYDAQLEQKQRTLEELLGQAGLVHDGIEPLLSMDDPYFYRNKMEFSFGDDRERVFACGLYPQGWHNEVINLGECFLQSPESNTILRAVRGWGQDAGLSVYNGRNNTGFLRNLVVREGKGSGERLVELITSGDEFMEYRGGTARATDVVRDFGAFLRATVGDLVTSAFWTQHVAIAGSKTRLVEHLLWGKPALSESFELDGGRKVLFEVHPRSFFQPNTRQGQRLAGLVVELALKGQGAKRVVDLYCGAGNLGLCLAPYVEEVLGVELVDEAVRDARRNATLNGLENATFVASDVGAWLETKEAAAWCEGVDLILLDPPRAGLIGSACDHVRAISAARIIYVSCNPEALMRDLARLAEVGYEVVTIQPVDMFPHTAHIETVVELRKGVGG
jgi:23S rRNA (uracil1939-C5)-methyltransferase